MLFSEQLCLFKSQVEDSCLTDFFRPLNGTGHGSSPSQTCCHRELVSVLGVRTEHGDLNQRPLTPQSVTLPTLPRAVWYNKINTITIFISFFYTQIIFVDWFSIECGNFFVPYRDRRSFEVLRVHSISFLDKDKTLCVLVRVVSNSFHAFPASLYNNSLLHFITIPCFNR